MLGDWYSVARLTTATGVESQHYYFSAADNNTLSVMFSGETYVSTVSMQLYKNWPDIFVYHVFVHFQCIHSQ